MSGPADNRGVNTRALDELFLKASERSHEWRDTITVSLLEVYNEEIRDLLSDGRGDDVKLEVKMGEHGNHVPGLTSVPVDGIQTVFNLLAMADRNRSSTATNMNEHSSRSHMMMTVTVVSEFLPTGATSRGKLNLVDLAGSERINKSGAVGVALKEAQNINKSLSALGDVIAARAQKTAHVPFRNSTLTFLLQDCLSQDSKTLMIVCVSPVLYNAEETFCSLNFAARWGFYGKMG
jgi:kinesin family protein C2/C3